MRMQKLHKTDEDASVGIVQGCSGGRRDHNPNINDETYRSTVRLVIYPTFPRLSKELVDRL